tara:strand:+ start:2704 stop:3741 length:1038 start_codon:yes stop_codon:yes gene_type:complete
VIDIDVGRAFRKIGGTPLVHVPMLSPVWAPDIKVFAKLERHNPTGSVKDRIAEYLVNDAIAQRGDLLTTIVEASSGNTASAVAAASAQKGLGCVIFIPNKTSEEKKLITESYGAKVIRAEIDQDYMQLAKDYAESLGNQAVFLNQYDNLMNREAHFRETGPEIIQDMQGGVIDAFVSVASTGGTISGIGECLKNYDEQIRVVMADPIYSVLFDEFYRHRNPNYQPVMITPDGHLREGMRFRDTLIEGVGKKRVPNNINFDIIDQAEKYFGGKALQLVQKINQNTDLSIGASSGANALIAQRVAEQLASEGREEANIITIFADGSEKYKSKFENSEWLTDAMQYDH